jgi:hypothetical protein
MRGLEFKAQYHQKKKKRKEKKLMEGAVEGWQPFSEGPGSREATWEQLEQVLVPTS